MSTPHTYTDVAAAVIEQRDGQFLLAQRPAGKVYAGYWEFPGGKVHADESPRDAVARELEEELGIIVEQAHPWITRYFHYEHASVRLHFFRVTSWHGTLRGREQQSFVWQRADALTVAPMLPANAPVLKSLRLPARYAITHAHDSSEEAFLPRLDAALAGGLRLVQVREPSWSRDRMARFAAQVQQRAALVSATVLINNDLALARELGAQGVHLRAAQLRELRARPDFDWVGASCHTEQELAGAAQLGADFAVLGPVQTTLSHPQVKPLGWAAFARLIACYTLPVYALGGLSDADLPIAQQHGAHGIALMRAAWSAT